MSQTFTVSEDENYDKPRPKRLVSIDILRGLVMVLMTLDHVRVFFSNARFDPLDLTQTNVPLFLTRWITHLCATSFIFLAGISAYLSLQRGKTKQEVSSFLFTRGLWLVFLELTVVRFGWTFNMNYSATFAGVLWAIGFAMIVLAGLVYLPTRAIAAIGIAMIVGHNLFDRIQADRLGEWGWLWAILHEPKRLEILPGMRFFTAYPLIPWIGVMAAGYAFGTVFNLPQSRRRQLLRRFGFGLILLFIILRSINIYGDPNLWAVQSSLPFTLLSFINCHKYPPSLLFLLMTIGPAILLLDLFEKPKISRFLKPLVLFGQVPLFFYIMHIPLIHLLAILLAIPTYGLEAFAISLFKIPPDYGYSLAMVYDFWIIVVLILYPLCNWFAEYKAKHKFWWLSYL